MSNDTTRVLVLDLSTLRYRFAANRRSLSVLTASGETLASVTMRPAEDDTDVIFRAITEAARTSCVLRANDDGTVSGHTLAFYNPYTAQVSWTLNGRPVLFVPEVPFSVLPAGISGTVSSTADILELRVADAVAAEEIPDSNLVARTLSAYR